MKTLLLFVLFLASCISAMAVATSFTTFDTNTFFVDQPHNFISTRNGVTNDPFGSSQNIGYVNISGTNYFYIFGTLTNSTTGTAQFSTFSPDGTPLNEALTNIFLVNSGPALVVANHAAFLNTNGLGGGGSSTTGLTNFSTIAWTNLATGVALSIGASGKTFLNSDGSGSTASGGFHWDTSGDIVANARSTAAAASIGSTLSWGGTGTGNGSGITALNASQLTTGTVPTARLASGSADALHFLRGDQVWALTVTNVLFTNAGPDTLILNDIAFLNTNGLGGGGGGSGITQLTGDVTAGPGSGSQAATLANIPSGVTMAGSLLDTAIVAPSTPASGKGQIYEDSTSKNIALKNDAGVVNHGVQTRASTTSQWIKSLADDGSSTISQPTYGDISGTLSLSGSAFANQGTTTTVLHGNASGNPSFGAVVLSTDVSGNLPVGNLNGGTGATAGTFWNGTGAWVSNAPSAGGITQLTGDVTAGPGSGSVAATVKGLNGTSLGSLQSGVLLNTFSTGVPSTVSSWPSLAAQLSSMIPQSALGSGSGGTGGKFLSDAQTYTTIPGAGFSNQLSSAVQHLAFNYVTNINTSTSVNGQAVGDMNGDGVPDIVVDTANSTKVFTNYAGGQVFPLASSFAQTSVSGGVTLADVNGDGRLDAIASSRTGQYWNVLTNDGNGNLAQLNTNYTFTGSPNFVSLYAAKVDNNSSIDVFRIDGTDTIAIYTNDGTGIFVLSTNLPSVWNTTAALAVGDLNGDGSTDFVMADPNAYTGGLFGFVTMTNNGNGVFSYYTTNQTSGVSGTYTAAIADFNGDGKNDIAVIMLSPSTQVVVYTNSGTAFFPWSTNVMSASTGAKLITGDFNLDGRVDLMASSLGGDSVYCWTNNGKGLFPAFTNTFGSSLDWIGTGDFNGDGWPDWDAYDVAGNIQVYLNTPNIVGNFVGNAASLTNGQITVAYQSTTPTPATAWAAGTPGLGTITINTNFVPLIQTSAATSGTVTATTGNPIQTTYMSSATGIGTLTFALASSSTTAGRLNYFHTRSTITNLTVTGGSFIDTAITTLTNGGTLIYQVVDGSGTYIRLSP